MNYTPTNNRWGVKPSKIEQNYYYKVVVIGDKGVGKETFINNFNDENKDIIISGIKRSKNSIKRIKILKYHKQKIRLQVCKYEEKSLGGGIDKQYFLNTSCFLLMFDVTDEDSLLSCKLWLKDIIKNSRPQTPILLLGNKNDRVNDKRVEVSQTIEFIYNCSEQLKITQDIPYFEISSKEPSEKLFNKIFKKAYKLIDERFNINSNNIPNKLSSSPEKKTIPSSPAPSTSAATTTTTTLSNNDKEENLFNPKRGSVILSKFLNILKKE